MLGQSSTWTRYHAHPDQTSTTVHLVAIYHAHLDQLFRHFSWTTTQFTMPTGPKNDYILSTLVISPLFQFTATCQSTKWLLSYIECNAQGRPYEVLLAGFEFGAPQACHSTTATNAVCVMASSMGTTGVSPFRYQPFSLTHGCCALSTTLITMFTRCHTHSCRSYQSAIAQPSRSCFVC